MSIWHVQPKEIEELLKLTRHIAIAVDTVDVESREFRDHVWRICAEFEKMVSERDALLKDKERLDELEKWECWLKVEGWEWEKRPTFYAGPICPISIRDAADRLIDKAKEVGQL